MTLRLKPVLNQPAQSVADFVFESLYAAVVQLDLPPGTRLSEAEVAERLKVSRQPVRDAFFRLAHRGFILIRPQRATLVTGISEAAVLHAAFIRVALETACVADAIARITRADLDDLHRMLAQQARAVDAEDTATFHMLDEAFHAKLCDIAGQPGVWQLINEQKGHMDRVRYLSLSFNIARAHREHEAIVRELERGDAEAAKAQMELHLSRIRDYLPKIREAQPEYFEDGV